MAYVNCNLWIPLRDVFKEETLWSDTVGMHQYADAREEVASSADVQTSEQALRKARSSLHESMMVSPISSGNVLVLAGMVLLSAQVEACQ